MTKHLQKFTAVLLAVIMTLGVFAVVPFTASAATISDGTEVSDMASSYGHVYGTLEENTGIYYSIIDDGTIEITGCIGTATEITIPSEIGGKPVTSIRETAFSGCTSLKSITIPDSVTYIGDSAFCNCTSLASITIPDSVTYIGGWAFSGIGGSAFSGTAWFDNQPDGLVYAGKVAYKYKGEMPENTSLTIKDGTKCISPSAFGGCRGLTSITIPDSVTFIDSWAFAGCSSLTNITIPDSVTYIGYQAFDYTAWFNNQPNGLVYAGKVAYEYKGEMPENTSIIIKDGTKSIGNGTFDGCTSLTSITIPDSVTSIGDYAFDDCSNLASINVNNNNVNYSSIDGVLFNKNKTVLIEYPQEKTDENYTIPDSVTSIGYRAFSSCENLTSITIPDSVTSIDESAFSDTAWFNNQPDGLVYAGKVAYKYKGEMPENTSLIIKDGTKSIADYAFEDCDSLSSVTIGNSVTSIGNSAFAGCSSLTSITIPDSVTRIGPSAFKDCTGLTSITIPDSVTSIGPWAFNGCTNLTNITIPDNVTSIGDSAFADCDSLSSVTIPDSVTSIGLWTFYNCPRLASVSIPESVTGIGDYAFGYYYNGDDDYNIVKNDSFTISGYKGTASETYANEYGFEFIALNNTSTPSLGDIDGDGKISVNDVTDIQKYIVQLKPFTDEQIKFADVDKNGKIDVNDVTLLQKVIVKIAVI